jgi:uncharacterized protein (TIGR03435 family)
MQSALNEPQSSEWAQFAPLLDEAMASLGETDRSVIALRFFEKKTAQEIAGVMKLNEETAKKRVARALEKLRKFFAKRGVNSTTAIIGENISAHSVQAAPAALAKAVTTVAIAKGVAASASTLTLIKGAMKVMAWTKTKTAVVAGVAVLLAGGTATVILPTVRRAILEREIIWEMDVQVLAKEPPVILIRPAQPIPGVVAGGGWSLGGVGSTGGKMIGRKSTVLRMLMLAYRNSTTEGLHLDRVIVSTNLPAPATQEAFWSREYDYIASTPAHQKEGLQQALKEKFNLSVHWESRETNVYLLHVRNAGAPGLKINETDHGGAMKVDKDRLSIQGGSLSELADFLENGAMGVPVPVLDRTGLTNSYDIELTWATKGQGWRLPRREELDQILMDQLGLELVPGRENVEFLVVEKAR